MAINYELLNSGAMTVGGGFNLYSKNPLDSRLVIPGFDGLQTLIDNGAAYEGMIAYISSEKKHYEVKTIDGVLSYRPFGLTNDELNEIIANATTAAMEFKGVAATLPENPTKGDMYKVSGETIDITIDGVAAKAGDSIVYNGEEWFLIPSGDDIEDTWRPIAGIANDATLTFEAGDKLDVAIASTGNVKYSHEAIAAPELLAENEQTRTYITSVETDGFGHITGYKTATENVEDTNTTYEFECQVEHSNVHFSVKASDAEQAQEVCVDAYTQNETDAKISDAVKVVTDGIATDRVVWDLASTAVQAETFTEFQEANTAAIEAAAKAGTDAAAEVGSKLTAYSELHAGDYTNEQIDTAISTATGNLGSMSTKDADDYLTKAEIEATYATDVNAQKYATDAQAAAEGTAKSALDAYKLVVAEELAKKQDNIPAETYDAFGSAAQALADAKEYANGLAHDDTTYVIAPTTNALEFTITPSVNGVAGEAETVTLIAPTVDTGVMEVKAGTSNEVIAVTTEDGVVTVSHKDYQTGTIKDASHDSLENPSFITGISIENGHVTGATVQNLAAVLEGMTFILDGGKAPIENA